MRLNLKVFQWIVLASGITVITSSPLAWSERILYQWTYPILKWEPMERCRNSTSTDPVFATYKDNFGITHTVPTYADLCTLRHISARALSTFIVDERGWIVGLGFSGGGRALWFSKGFTPEKESPGAAAHHSVEIIEKVDRLPDGIKIKFFGSYGEWAISNQLIALAEQAAVSKNPICVGVDRNAKWVISIDLDASHCP